MSCQPNLTEEQRLWSQGYLRIAGLDEAGRGAWAGPVVAAAVILPVDPDVAMALAPIRDSKLLTPRQREHCYEIIVEHALAYGIGACPASEIDRLGIVPATRAAMCRALAQLSPPADYLLIDALSLPQIPLPQRGIIKGDRSCLSIAAASILAKVTRDRWMIALDEHLPGYGLARHKGYGTAQHRAALYTFGPTAQHRHSYAPVRALDQEREARDD